MSVDRCLRCGSERNYKCVCGDVSSRFIAQMDAEIRRNADKGGRNGVPDHRGGMLKAGWAWASPDELLAEIHDHAAKLHVAARELERRHHGEDPRDLPWGDRDPASLVLEFAADTANMAMMLCDSFGLLAADKEAEAVWEGQQ